MKLNTLQPKEGSKTTKLKIGRGIGSGKGKTSGRGQKGQKAREGNAIKGFEGGQMPLDRRLPKNGFRNTAFATQLAELNLGKLQAAIDAKQIDTKTAIDEEALVKAGVIRRKRDGVKLLGVGALKTKVDLKVTKASKSAQAAVEKAGGKIEFVEKTVAPLVKGESKKKAEKKPAKKAEKKAEDTKSTE